MNEGVVLGNHISSNGIKFHPPKVTIILDLLAPQKQKDVKIFLRYEGYYRMFIKYFIKIGDPMFSLLAKDVEFEWENEFQIEPHCIKEKLMSTSIFQGPKLEIPFHIHSNESDKVVGVVIQKQEEINPMPYIVGKFNHILKQLNYSIH